MSAATTTGPGLAPGPTSRARALLSRLPPAAVLALATVLYTWGLGRNGHANTYYSAAALSGTQSWKAFFFGALDAGSFITVDKPPLALWVTGLSVRVFGLSSWSLLLPQAAAGVATVWLLHTAVRRSVPGRPGRVAAHLAALVLALTPITVAINRDNNPDPILVLLLTGAACACLAALRDGRIRPLLLCAVLVGLAFNTKMLQAYLVLPAFAGVYLYAAPGSLARRLRALAAAGAALLVSSAWWMTIVDLWPAADRPFVGGSTHNSMWDLVIGYNGLGRFLGAQAGTHHPPAFGGDPGPGRMFNDLVAGQISWLLPFALIALVAGPLILSRVPTAGFPHEGGRRTEPVRAALSLWGGWLVAHLLVFSFTSGVFHPYYTAVMAPAIAALSGIGAVLLWRARTHSRAWACLPPACIALTTAWAFTVLRRTPEFAPWLPWTLAATSTAITAALTLRTLARVGPAWLRVLVPGAAVVVGLGGPAAFAVMPLGAAVSGGNPTAGPEVGPIPGLPPGVLGASRVSKAVGFGGRPGGFEGRVSEGLIAYLKHNQGGATWLAAFGNAQPAAQVILDTGRPALAMGGFLGSDPAMTVERLRDLVAAGRLRYVVPGGGVRAANRGDRGLTQWVEATCAPVDPVEYGERRPPGWPKLEPTPKGRRGDGTRVYRCGG
ncbi:ArnT family glycosyltransferase [Spongiactinospora rosea]|uniref:ArnT family glycosyltransferase n=1 Tax=Spongiactinospora rosea TaxID=2248750 RepID=UPI001CEDBA0D|nr:glycosyltransferase family 39 protein [Spongiactinospora rosea]